MSVPAEDHELAKLLAAEAGELLLQLRREHADADERSLGALGDRRSHDLLMRRLTAARPHDAVLSEEGADDQRRLSAKRVWIVDPLDGTREFGEAGRDDWAVHVALWQDDLVAGAVALPAQSTVLSTLAPPHRGDVAAPLRIAVSRTRPPTWTDALAEILDATTVPMGSAGAKIAAVMTGGADVYVHAGGQYEWDSAAPVAIARAAGLHCSRIDGSPLLYNRRNPRLPDLVVCPREIADRVLNAVASAMGS